MKCDQPNCKERALGWRTLKTGGSARVGTCKEHTDRTLFDRLAPIESSAAVPSVATTQPEPKKGK